MLDSIHSGCYTLLLITLFCRVRTGSWYTLLWRLGLTLQDANMFFKDITHRHTWSEWIESSWNSHPWSHTRELYQYCLTCNARRERITELHCREFIRTGKYCHSCERYAETWAKRFDEVEFLWENEDMKKQFPTIRKGRPIESIARNIEIVLKHEFYNVSFRQMADEEGKKDHKAYWRTYHNTKPLLNMKKVKEAVGLKA